MPIDMTPAPAPGTGDASDAHAGAGEQQQQAQPQTQADAPALKPNELRLRDGRIVAMRKSSIDDDEAVLDLLGQEGKQLNNLAPQTIWRANALYSLVHIDGRAVMPPRTVDEMKGLRKLFDSLDGAALMEKWAEIQAGGGDFRSRG